MDLRIPWIALWQSIVFSALTLNTIRLTRVYALKLYVCTYVLTNSLRSGQLLLGILCYIIGKVLENCF